MTKIKLSDFIIKGPDFLQNYYIVRNNFAYPFKEGPFNSDQIESAKIKIFLNKISVNRVDEKFEILFDGHLVRDIDNPASEKEMTDLLKKYGLLFNKNECKVYYGLK